MAIELDPSWAWSAQGIAAAGETRVCRYVYCFRHNFSPWLAQNLHDHVLDILMAKQNALLMNVSQQPVLICL